MSELFRLLWRVPWRFFCSPDWQFLDPLSWQHGKMWTMIGQSCRVSTMALWYIRLADHHERQKHRVVWSQDNENLRQSTARFIVTPCICDYRLDTLLFLPSSHHKHSSSSCTPNTLHTLYPYFISYTGFQLTVKPQHGLVPVYLTEIL